MRRAATTITAVNVAFFIASAAWLRADDQPTDATSKQELTSEWKQEVEVPEAKSNLVTIKAAKLILWVEQNWLVVRREKPNGYWDWQIVFAHVADRKPPQVLLKDRGAIEIKYGPYFIRETGGYMRVFREKKTGQSSPWPAIPLPVGYVNNAVVNNPNVPGFTGRGWKVGDWEFWSTGIADNQNDIWVRIRNMNIISEAPNVSKNGPFVSLWLGEYLVRDEGDLFTAQRMLEDDEEVAEMLRIKKIHAELKGSLAPALDIKRWINTRVEQSLDQLRGKAVLLYFWNSSPQTVFRSRASTEAANSIVAKFAPRGLVAIAIHSNDGSEKLDAVKLQNSEWRIAIDAGETFKRYAVDAIPTFFLIDKDGKIAWWGVGKPPTEKEIEDVLK